MIIVSTYLLFTTPSCIKSLHGFMICNVMFYTNGLIYVKKINKIKTFSYIGGLSKQSIIV